MSDFVFCQDCGKILTQSKGEYDHGCLDCHGSVQSEKLFWLRKENKKLKAAVLELSETLGNLQGHASASLLFPHKERIDLFESERRARETLARYEELLKQIKEGER